MCSWDKLPAEVLSLILDYLKNSRSTLGHCQLTCRAWRDPAQKQFYHSVRLESGEQAKLFTNFAPNNASHFVRTLSLGQLLCKSPAFEFIFPRLFDVCKNLTRLEASSAQSSAFWSKLLLEYAKGNLTQLREIPLPDLSHDDGILSYGYVALVLKDSLTSLTMCDWPYDNPSLSYDRLSQSLQQFQKLEKVDICLRRDKSIYGAFELLLKCTPLQSVNISITDINRNLYGYEQEDENDPDWQDAQMTSTNNIQRLNMEYIPLTSKIIQYITHLFPKLNEFYFKCENPNWEEDMDLLGRVEIAGLLISSDLWIEFLLYLYRHVPTFHVSSLFIEDIPAVLGEFVERTTYGEIVKVAYYERDAMPDFQPSVAIDSKSGSKLYNRKHSLSSDRCVEIVCSVEEDHYDELPHLAVLERIGYKVKALDIQIQSGNRFGDVGSDVYNMACGYYLDHALEFCPLLDMLNISNSVLHSCSDVAYISQSVQVLRMEGCSVKSSVYSQLSSRLPRLSYFVLSDPASSTYFSGQIDEPVPFMIDMPDNNFHSVRIDNISPVTPDVLYIIVTFQDIDYHYKWTERLGFRPISAIKDGELMNLGARFITFSCKSTQNLILQPIPPVDVWITFENNRPKIEDEPGSNHVYNTPELQT